MSHEPIDVFSFRLVRHRLRRGAPVDALRFRRLAHLGELPQLVAQLD
jgi:hypothetical protein